MGGIISIGIRHALRGEPVCEFMQRWTNDIPWRVMQPDFLDGSGAQLRSFLNDQHKGEDDYCWRTSRLKASEYGFILIDLVSRTALSANHYTAISQSHYFPGISTTDDETYAGLAALCSAGSIATVEEVDLRSASGACRRTPDDFLRLSRAEIAKARMTWKFTLAPSTLSVEVLRERCTLRQAIAWMKPRGWSLSSAPAETYAHGPTYAERCKRGLPVTSIEM